MIHCIGRKQALYLLTPPTAVLPANGANAPSRGDVPSRGLRANRCRATGPCHWFLEPMAKPMANPAGFALDSGPEGRLWQAFGLARPAEMFVPSVQVGAPLPTAGANPQGPYPPLPDRSPRRICFSISISAKKAMPMVMISAPSHSGTGLVPRMPCNAGR